MPKVEVMLMIVIADCRYFYRLGLSI